MDGRHSNANRNPAERQHQRFSWQPVAEGNTLQYPQVRSQHQQPQQMHQYHIPQQQQTTNAADLRNRHFSYAQTPVEHEAFVYIASPTDPPMPQLPRDPVQSMHQTSPHTPIDPRPQSTFNPLIAAQPQLQPQPAYISPPSHTLDTKPPVSPTYPHQATNIAPTSPAARPSQYQSHAQLPSLATAQNNHARKMSNLSPINTNVSHNAMPLIPPTSPQSNQTGPLPPKPAFTPMSPDDYSTIAKPAHSNRQSYATSPYSPHGFSTTAQTSNVHAVFSPDAAHGPNGLDFSLHQPGQIAHPNMDSVKSPQWTHSLFACSPSASTCLTGLVCPCILYGRTSYRLSQKSAKKDPTDMLGHSTTNGHCLAMGLACGLWWLFPMLQRTRIRHAYKLEGGFCGDLAKGCCCCCCVAVQNEREVKEREEASRRWAGPASADVYSRNEGMVYKPQQ